jgi:hypothetical protein
MLDHSLNDTHDALAISGDAEWFEYGKAANPIRPSLSPEVPPKAFLPDLYADGRPGSCRWTFPTSCAAPARPQALGYAPTSAASWRARPCPPTSRQMLPPNWSSTSSAAAVVLGPCAGKAPTSPGRRPMLSRCRVERRTTTRPVRTVPPSISSMKRRCFDIWRRCDGEPFRADRLPRRGDSAPAGGGRQKLRSRQSQPNLGAARK